MNSVSNITAKVIVSLRDGVVARIRRNALFISTLLFLAGVLVSCSSSEPEQPAPYKGLTFSIERLPPSRPGEVYALWLEKPILAAPGQTKPLHGVNLSELVTLFTINSKGQMIGFDTASLYTKLDLKNTILEAEVSIEASSVIGPNPSNIVMAGDAVNQGNTREITFSSFHRFAFSDSLFGTHGEAVLASAPDKPENYKHEFYFMRRDAQQNLSAGLTSFKLLKEPWRYGLWVIDSSVQPAKAAFLGFPYDASLPDAKGGKDSYPFPGGRVPVDSTAEAWDLTTGSMTVLLTLESRTSVKDPSQPSGLILLKGTIPTNAQPFAPFSVENQSSNLPTGTVRLIK